MNVLPLPSAQVIGEAGGEGTFKLSYNGKSFMLRFRAVAEDIVFEDHLDGVIDSTFYVDCSKQIAPNGSLRCRVEAQNYLLN